MMTVRLMMGTILPGRRIGMIPFIFQLYLLKRKLTFIQANGLSSQCANLCFIQELHVVLICLILHHSRLCLRKLGPFRFLLLVIVPGPAAGHNGADNDKGNANFDSFRCKKFPRWFLIHTTPPSPNMRYAV